ncbi:MAG: phosphopantetheine-binding protein [Actinomycetota bacterium]|nr:phosphopantetheine-binding protein [Actinomycetota bacterium]
MTNDVGDQISEFIRSRYPGLSFDEDADIFALGLVNSLFAAELVLFVEKQMGVQVPSAELEIDNFRSIKAMRSLMDRLGAATTSPLAGA